MKTADRVEISGESLVRGISATLLELSSFFDFGVAVRPLGWEVSRSGQMRLALDAVVS